MSSFNYTKDTVHVKRLPFIDKTNLLSPKHSVLPQKSSIESYVTDPKLQLLVSKVNVQSKHNLKTPHYLQSSMMSAPKLKLVSKLTNKHVPNTSHNLQSLKDSAKKIISNDPKFALIPKVNLERLNINDKIPLGTKSRKNGDGDAISMVSNKKCVTSSGKIKAITLMPKELSVSKEVIPKKTKTTLVPVVPLSRSKEKINNKSQDIIKKVQFTEDIISLPKFDKALRKRRTKNYTETSITATPSPKKQLEISYVEHVPVYLQNRVSAQIQAKEDPYEFKFYSPKSKRPVGRPPKKIRSALQFEIKKKRGRPRKNREDVSDSDSSVYDKSMHKALQQIRLKVSPKKCKPVRHIKKVKQNNKVPKNGQSHIAPSNAGKQKNGMITLNVKVKAGPSDMQAKEQNLNQISNKNTKELVSSGKIKTRLPLNGMDNGSTVKLMTGQISRSNPRISNKNTARAPKPDDVYNCFGFDDDYEEDLNDISRVLPSPRLGSNTKTTTDKLKPLFASTSTPLPTSKKKIHIISNLLINAPTAATGLPESNSGKFLGVNNSYQCGSSSATVASKILQNVATSPNNDIVDSNMHRATNTTQENLCSFVNNRSASKKQKRASHPWRGDRLQIRRNPHFLAMKDTSLPCYNQQMILEPKMLEKSKTPTRRRKKRNSNIQTSILDFVSSNKINNESTPTKKNHDRSLFDDGEFSPIRDYSIQVNSSPKNLTETPKSKRNIFGVHTKQNEISPLRERNREETFGLENYFGFDSPVHKPRNGKENVRKRRKQNKLNEEALPMRVPIQQVRKIRKEAVEELFDVINLENIPEEPSEQEIIKNALPSENAQGENIPHVGLFEDLAEIKPPPRIYERKRAKRTRARCVSTDTEETVVEKPKRKRKDEFTPAEEEEYNKWAKEFNAMCNEIEKHDLTLV